MPNRDWRENANRGSWIQISIVGQLKRSSFCTFDLNFVVSSSEDL